MKPTRTMREALRKLDAPPPCCAGIGRPTKQRLAKYGLATYTGAAGDWDGAMQITDAGRQALRTPRERRRKARAQARHEFMHTHTPVAGTRQDQTERLPTGELFTLTTERTACGRRVSFLLCNEVAASCPLCAEALAPLKPREAVDVAQGAG